ncbi:hypothetical protein D1157_15645, partial [Anaerotruncus sp. X29]|nr:hypothetical protein [Anaerotruncus sp. X29]
LFRKALCDLFVLFFLQFHSLIIAYLYLCEQTLVIRAIRKKISMTVIVSSKLNIGFQGLCRLP